MFLYEFTTRKQFRLQASGFRDGLLLHVCEVANRTANLIIIDVRYQLPTVFSTSLLLENR